jgi:cyclophilin family peptidyl-prolyl cis-trans isomerase
MPVALQLDANKETIVAKLNVLLRANTNGSQFFITTADTPW